MKTKTPYLIGSGRLLEDANTFVFQVINPEVPEIIKEISGTSESSFKENFLKVLPSLKRMNLQRRNYSFSTLFHREKQGIYSSSMPLNLVLFIKKELWGDETL